MGIGWPAENAAVTCSRARLVEQDAEQRFDFGEKEIAIGRAGGGGNRRPVRGEAEPGFQQGSAAGRVVAEVEFEVGALLFEIKFEPGSKRLRMTVPERGVGQILVEH